MIMPKPKITISRKTREDSTKSTAGEFDKDSVFFGNSITCYIGLGGNIANELGTPAEHIANAVQAFQNSSHFNHVQVSSLYQSKAFGVTDQPDFINAVLKADTDLPPLALLDFCQSLETGAKRERLRHWGERSLDVDVVLYGDENIQNERLTVPHAGLFERNFVLIPLLEISPNLTVNGQKLADLAESQNWQGLDFYKD